MPSKRRQLNVRTDEETEQRVERLLTAVSAALGLNVSMSDLFRLGMIELERKYIPTSSAPAVEGAGGPSKGRQKGKGAE